MSYQLNYSGAQINDYLKDVGENFGNIKSQVSTNTSYLDGGLMFNAKDGPATLDDDVPGYWKTMSSGIYTGAISHPEGANDGIIFHIHPDIGPRVFQLYFNLSPLGVYYRGSLNGQWIDQNGGIPETNTLAWQKLLFE